MQTMWDRSPETRVGTKAGLTVMWVLVLTTSTVTLHSASSRAAETDEPSTELAKKLANPLANIISVPLQSNWDFGIGPKDAMRYTLNIQPVIPFALNDHWNLIIRTILPVINAETAMAGMDSVSGIGDITQSFFFATNAEPGDWMWGAGPVLLWPTTTDRLLGAGR